MDWIQRMNLVLDYIENNLDGEIEENKIAGLSASPKGMFQRIFSALTEMSLSEYIRKRRLTQAALDIQNTDEKIIDIALKYGYTSADAFSFAFKNFHGVTPSDAKKPDSPIQSFYPFFFEFKLSVKVKGGNDMQERIIENAIEKLNFEPMVLDLFINGKLTAKGHITCETPSETEVKVADDFKSEIKNILNLEHEETEIIVDKVSDKFIAKVKLEKTNSMFPLTFDLFDWKFKVIEIVDESNTLIKVNDIIEFSEKMKSRTAGGLFFSKEDKLIATVEENAGLLITESIKIN